MKFLTIKYPTKEEIMKIEQKFKPEVLTLVKAWKNLQWKQNKNDESIYQLLTLLSQVYWKPLCLTNLKTDSHYNPQTRTINLHNTSIITALHEFAHHLFGPSELKACRWSVWLFKKTFPNNFKKLKWDGHMLTK